MSIFVTPIKSLLMTVEILNKEQFLEAVKEDPTLLLSAEHYHNNQWEEVVMFSSCSEPFTMDEYKELYKEYILGLDTPDLCAEHMIEIHSPIPPLKGESVFSPKNIARTHKTGVPREMLDELEKEILSKE